MRFMRGPFALASMPAVFVIIEYTTKKENEHCIHDKPNIKKKKKNEGVLFVPLVANYDAFLSESSEDAIYICLLYLM